MVDFLAENNLCGQTILNLVSWGNAIIAELLRLADFVPPVFVHDAQQKNEITKYSDLLFDFSYFKNSEYYENNIATKPGLEDLDEEFKDNYLEILTRFYQAFESIHKYISDLNRFIEDVKEGVFIQQNVESLLQNEDGKQLMCESIYLYGVMLLVLDLKFEGVVREKMLVSYYRYSASRSSESNIDEVCKLLRSTGFSNAPGSKKPQNYPESYFSRSPIDKTLIAMVLSRLRSDDIYNQVSVYPLPEHRSTALSTQSAMLYVILYFSPDVLNNQQAAMREIVDKFFPDNWVISIYMGLTVNLCDAWMYYRAASQALSNTLEVNNIRRFATQHGTKATELLPLLNDILKQGVLSEEYAINNISKLMNISRSANVTLRWLMLHTSPIFLSDGLKKSKQLREQVFQDCNFDQGNLFKLLLLTAELELRLKEMFKKLLDEKKQMWNDNKKEGMERMKELSEVFRGDKPLTRIEKNENLQVWFNEMGKQIDLLNHEDSTAAGRKTIQLIQALEEVQEFHQLDCNMQVKQFLEDTRKFLHQMLRIININEDILITLQIVADLSYAWQIVDNFTSIMQNGIKKDPSLVTKLRSTFLKLASALDLPLLRINQSNSSDLISVSQYYSGELVIYVRKVLQVIPETMFSLLAKIIDLQTNKIKEVPTRLDKDKMREFAQFNERYEVARLTHSISVLTEGMLMMKATLVGVIKINPKQLLEDGIRKELVTRVAKSLDKSLVFNPRAKTSELMNKLDEVGLVMDGFKRSFEYIQDYVDIFGLKIWQGEVSRIINYNVEQECNSFLRNKIQDWQSMYQSKTIPIPRFAPIDSSVNFIGRLTREILRITDSRVTTYLDHKCTWYDLKTRTEIVTLKLFEKLEKSVGTWGLTGVDKLLSFMIVQCLQKLTYYIARNILSDKIMVETLEKLEDSFRSENYVQYQKTLVLAQTKLSKFSAFFMEVIFKVGQMQLLRRLISYQLSSLCNFDSKFFFAALKNLNCSLLSEIEKHYLDPVNPMPKDSNPLLFETSAYLESAGYNEPPSKIYISTNISSHVAELTFLLVSIFLQKLMFVKSLDALLSRKTSENMDGMPFIMGIVTFLKQYHSGSTTEFVSCLAGHVKSYFQSNQSVQLTNVAPEAVTGLAFLDKFVDLSGLNKEIMTAHLPSIIVDHIKAL